MYDRSLLIAAVREDVRASKAPCQLVLDQDFDCDRSERPFALGAEAALSLFIQSRKLQQFKVICSHLFLLLQSFSITPELAATNGSNFL